MSKAVIITLTSIIIVLLAALGGFVYYTNFTPAAKAGKITTTFMGNVRGNNQQNTANTSTVSRDDMMVFFKQASLRDYRSDGTVLDGSTYYFSYKFTDDQSPKKARIAVKDQKIVAVKAGDKLGALPKDDGQEVVANNDYSTDTCLSVEDLSYIDSTNIYAESFRAMTMIFANTTSTDYSGDKSGQRIINRLVDFYKKSNAKDYKIELRGYAPEDPQQYIKWTQISQNRANKIKAALIKEGVGADRIIIKQPTVYTTDTDQKDPRRAYLDINIENLCRD